MSVLVDSGVFVALHNTRDENHETAKKLITMIASGEMGTAYTSDYVFDEAVTVTLKRTGKADVALRVGRMILGERPVPFLVVLRVAEDVFKSSWVLFQKYSERGLSFTDCTSIALIEMREMHSIVSFDSGFDGIVPRIAS
jgi:predicted nucleic acid-binding protein